jgi:hypothetical protein
MVYFPYVGIESVPASYMSRLPLTLHLQGRTLDVVGLVDSGSSLSVLPYDMTWGWR